ncbi:MAG: hypothetical protein QM760_08330 [Nibricoccus sp.]
MSVSRRIRIAHFCPWADGLEDAGEFLSRLPTVDVTKRVSNPGDPALVRMARLDCDWHGENTRAFAAMKNPVLQFLPAFVTGAAGLLSLVQLPAAADEERWLIFDGQNPQKIADVVGKLLTFLKRSGWRVLLYGFDEVSRTMPCFGQIAPHLDILIHDEFPLDKRGRASLSAKCRTIHRSWVANLVPFAAPFVEAPEEKIFFLGSKLGLTDNRLRQIEFLEKKFPGRVVASRDHSVSVADKTQVNRYKVSLCPEGRKFTTAAMSATHTDRPFWSGCLGMVPVSENSKEGNRLESLHREGLVIRYEQGDLDSLGAACERALTMSRNERHRIYQHFNQHETVGTVVADALVTFATTSS